MRITVTNNESKGKMIRFMEAYIDDTLMVNEDPIYANKIYLINGVNSLDYVPPFSLGAQNVKLSIKLYIPD